MDQETIGGSMWRWRSRWALGCFLLASLVAPVGAEAHSYKALVTASEGPLAGVFLELMTIQIAYTFRDDATDVDPRPDHGRFPAAVLSLSLEIPGFRGSIVAGSSGQAQTFYNVVDEASGLVSDQVFLMGGPITSVELPGGEQVSAMEVDFLSDFVAPPQEPKMLDSDELPTYRLLYHEGFVRLESSGGTTVVTFEPVDSIEDDGCAIASSDHTGIGGAWLLLLPALLLWRRQRLAPLWSTTSRESTPL